MGNIFKVGIIGAGAVGLRIAKGMQQHESFAVTAVCDANETAAITAARELGGVPTTADYQTLLSADIDLFYLGVPPVFHHQIAMDILAARKNIFCEKPLALTLPQALEMATAARSAGVVHAMHLPLHYDAGVRTFLSLIKSGYVGDVKQATLELVFPQWPRAWQQNSWIAGREQGGMIREVSPHLFHVMLQALGPVARLQANVQYPDDPFSSEQSAIATLALERGVDVAVRALCNVRHQEVVRFTVYGSGGTLCLDDWAKTLGTQSPTHPLTPVAPQGALASVAPAGPHGAHLFNELAKALRGEPADLCGFEVGLAIQSVLDAWERSADTGDWTEVKAVE